MTAAGPRLLLAALVMSAFGCGAPGSRKPDATSPDSCEARLDSRFRAFAAPRRSCSTASECSIVRAECPLSSVAVRWTLADAVVAERDRLVAEAARLGSCDSCAGGAAVPPVASCVAAECELALPTLGDER